MPQNEIYGTRSGAYSAWHRRDSTRRFVGIEKAQLLAMIDIDAMLWVEYDDKTKEPLVLIETAVDSGQTNKPATVTQNLAKRVNLPAFTVLYTLSHLPNPSAPENRDISNFRVKRLWPAPEITWRNYTPEKYAQLLLDLRRWQSEQIDKMFVKT